MGGGGGSIQGLGFGVESLSFRVKGSGVWDLGSGVWDLGFRVEVLGFLPHRFESYGFQGAADAGSGLRVKDLVCFCVAETRPGLGVYLNG